MRIRIIFDSANELQTLPDGTIIETEDNGCAFEPHCQDSFEKTADGLVNYCKAISWDSDTMEKLLDENNVYIEYFNFTGKVSIPITSIFGD